jgi:transposase
MIKTRKDDFSLFVGIDVAQRTSVVSWVSPNNLEQPEPFVMKQTADGMAALRERLLQYAPAPQGIHVTLEATGSYHEQLAHYLYEQKFALSIINPVQAKRFAELFLQRDKNDQLDAWTLARYGLQMRPRLWSPPPVIYGQLNQYLTYRTALIKTRTELLNRQHATDQKRMERPTTEQHIKELIALLRRQVNDVEQEMARTLAQDAAWQSTVNHIMTIPGVGFTTAVWVTALTLNFTVCDSPKQLSAFVGLVPRQGQSGTSLSTYSRVGNVGHDALRQHLYVATMSALRYNPKIKTFYDGVKERRGSHKLACVAATHKLLHIIWAVAKKGERFDPNHGLRRSVKTA